MDRMLEAALEYSKEGLCVIPVILCDKRPAIDWEPYQTRKSTTEEIVAWFGNGQSYNIGAVHGPVSQNYVLLDIDHDAGLYAKLCEAFPELVAGRIIQSGSGEGYHIPLMLEELPNFGQDHRRKRPRGNRTWKTRLGNLNVRCMFCQSVLPPSIHPSGRPYRFLREGSIARLHSLEPFIVWLNSLAPTAPPTPAPDKRRKSNAGTGGDLIAEVRAAWPDVFAIFDHFGITGERRQDPDGETRVLGHGGLLVTQDAQVWYNFSDEIGGGVVEAWGWCRFGSAYDKRLHFRQCLLEMAQSAGIDAARYYRQGDERVMVKADGDRSRWSKQYSGAWERTR